ncbi:MAG: hypothetical protein NBV67_07070 [Tagaea sp.]|nr:hypothetical protein [Tagaea sp.]
MKVAGHFELGAVVIPLPAGNWVLAGRGETIGREATGQIRIANVFLVEQAHGQMARIVTAQAPLRGQGSGNGWVRNRGICDRTNVLHNESDRNFNVREARCWQINHYVISAPNNPNEPLQDFYSWMQENSLTLPKLRVVSEHFLTASGPYITVSYAFNPQVMGMDPGPAERWDSTDWSVSQIAAHPDKKAFADGMKAFATAIQAELERGLQGRLEKGGTSTAQLPGWPARTQ